MTARQLVEAVERIGGSLAVDGERLRYRIPDGHDDLVDALRVLKADVMNIIHTRIELPVACRCSERSYPHIHGLRDRQAAVRKWNKDSKHQVVEPIQ